VKTATVLVFVAILIGSALFGTGYTRLAADSGASAPSCRGSARAMARLEMLFGTSRPHGPPVSDDEWSAFLDNEVTPRFPAGLTVLRGPGQWRDGAGRLAKEQSHMLVIWHEPTFRTDADIEAIRSAYKTRFDQESVLRIDSVSCVSF
jgi:hypothetical protein